MRNCVFCLEPLQILDQENVLLTEENQIYKSIFECSREFVFDVLKRDVSKDWIPTSAFPSPMCFMCFKKSEKVFLVRKQLTETQRQLKKLIEELIIEINTRYSQNSLQFSWNGEHGQRKILPKQETFGLNPQDNFTLSMSTDAESNILSENICDSLEVKVEPFEDEEYQESYAMEFSNDVESDQDIRDHSQSNNDTTTDIENCKAKSLQDLIESCKNSKWPRVLLKRLEVRGDKYVVPIKDENSQEKISFSLPKESVKSTQLVNRNLHQTCVRNRLKMRQLKKRRCGSLSTREIDCEQCDKKFRSSSQLKTHMAIAHGQRAFFVCEICGRKLSNWTNLKNHRAVHSEARGKRHSCDICDKRFYYRGGLNRHLRRKHGNNSGEMKYPCDICSDKLFSSPETLHRHQEIRHVPYTNEVFHCQKCGQKFLDGVHMFWHSRKKEVTHSRHNCPLCCEKFVTRCDLLIHYSDSHPHEELPDKCAKCQLTFNSKLAWERHSKDCGYILDFFKWVQDAEVYECKICGDKFTEDSVQAHKLKHWSEPFSCGHCDKTFTTKSLLERHEKSHGGRIQPVSCSVCGKIFSSLGRMKHHERYHSETPSEKLFSCSFCSMSFRNENGLTKHEKRHKSSGFECDICGKSYLFEYHLNHHKREVHKVECEIMRFLCDHCGRSFASSHSLQCHKKKHNDGKSLMCGQCGFCFSTAHSLAKHEKLHGEEKRPYKITYQECRKRYECELCEKIYTSYENIKNHIRVKHTGEMPFSCSDCDRRFPSFQKLSVHKKHSHKEGTDSVCHICGKGFKLAQYLRVHLQTHSKEKQMKCDVCGVTFSSKSNWKRHQTTHTGEQHYQCQVCSKSFSQAQTLRTHERIHTGERPFVCPVCGKDFSDKSTWYKHRKIHHGERK